MFRSRRSPLIVFVLGLVVLFCLVAVAYAYVVPMLEQRLTTSDKTQAFPAISGTKVVYQDERNGNSDIYLYDLATSTEKRLTTNDQTQAFPAISGTKVVYADTRNGNWDIYLYDLATSTEKRLTTNDKTQILPAISGTKVVYQDNRNGNSDIYLYDLATSTEKRLTANDQAQAFPDISGTKVVYQDDRNGNRDIYLYDLATSTEKRLTTNDKTQASPAISGTKVVWEDYRNGNRDIYLYDLERGAEVRLTTDGASPEACVIDGARVVFHDIRNGNADIYLGELALPRISASAPTVVSYNATAKVTGTLTSVSGIPIAGRGVTLEVSADGVVWSATGAASTSSSGAFSLTSPRLKTARWLRANFRGDGAYLSAQSAAVRVKPKVSLTRPSFGTTTLTYGKTYKARGYLKPQHAEGSFPVRIAAYRYSKGKYRYVKAYSAKAFDYSTHTRYVNSIKLPKTGKWRLRAVHAQDSLNAKTYSSWRYVTVK